MILYVAVHRCSCLCVQHRGFAFCYCCSLWVGHGAYLCTTSPVRGAGIGLQLLKRMQRTDASSFHLARQLDSAGKSVPCDTCPRQRTRTLFAAGTAVTADPYLNVYHTLSV
jgi:hypothetical protein